MLRAERLSLDIKKSLSRNFRDVPLHKFSELLNKACGLWSRKFVNFWGQPKVGVLGRQGQKIENFHFATKQCFQVKLVVLSCFIGQTTLNTCKYSKITHIWVTWVWPIFAGGNSTRARSTPIQNIFYLEVGQKGVKSTGERTESIKINFRHHLRGAFPDLWSKSLKCRNLTKIFQKDGY